MKLISLFLLVFFALIISVSMTFVVQYFWKKYQGLVQNNNLSRIYLPDKMIFLVITGIGLLLLEQYFPDMGVRYLGWNLALVMSLAYFIQGFSLLYFFSKKWKIENWIIIFALGLFLIFGFNVFYPSILVLAIIGTLDFWKDFRNLNTIEIEKI